MPLAGKDANLRIASGTATTSTGVACSESTGTIGNGFVQIDSTAARHIVAESTPTLYLNSTAVSSTNYTVNPVQGKFEWLSGDPTTGTYTADIEYYTVSQVSGGREWQLNVETDMFEVSEFGSSGWKQFQPNLSGATATIGKYWVDETFFDLFNTESKFVVELMTDSTGLRYEGYVRIVSDQINTPTDGLVGESVNVQFDGPVYYST